jgi:uncharacterized protein
VEIKKNSTKCWIAVLVLALALVPCARADEASKRAKAEELIAMMHMDRMMDQMTQAMTAQVQQMLQQTPGVDSMTPEQKKIMADFEEKSIKMVMDSVGWKALQPDFVKVYAQTFTEEELDGLVAFYKSPTGQAFLTKMPQLTTASMQIAQSRMVDLQPKLKALQDEFVKKMSDAAAPQESSPSTKKN